MTDAVIHANHAGEVPGAPMTECSPTACAVCWSRPATRTGTIPLRGGMEAAALAVPLCESDTCMWEWHGRLNEKQAREEKDDGLQS